jgi:hypothetical protein
LRSFSPRARSDPKFPAAPRRFLVEDPIMRIVPVCLMWAAVDLFAVPSAEPGMLDGHSEEWAFDLNYTNQTSTATSTNVNFSWGHLMRMGYVETGLSGTYQRLGDRSATGGQKENLDGVAIGIALFTGRRQAGDARRR